MKLRPAASTRTTICPGPGEGSGASARRRTSGPPKPSIRMAFMGNLRGGAGIGYDETCYAGDGEGSVRKLSRREKTLLGLLAAAGVALSVWVLRPSDAAPAVLGRPRAEKPLPPVPRIDLARIDAPRAESEAGRRDLFQFGSAPEPEEDAASPAVVSTPPP